MNIAGIADVIGFHADNVKDLREAFGAALVAAQVKGMSLNQWASQALREAAHT